MSQGVRWGRRGTAFVVAFIAVLSAIGLFGLRRVGTEPRVPAFDYQGITALEVAGPWQIEVEPGTGPLEIDVPRGVDPSDLIDREGDRLILRAPRGFTRAEAVVYVQDLQELTLSGAVQVELGALEVDELALQLDGVVAVEADGLRARRLQLDAAGGSRVDFEDAEVVDAELNVDGATRIELTMSGGTLSGQLNGAGSLEVGGQVGQREISTSGAFRVEVDR